MKEAVRSQTVLAYWLLPAAPARQFLGESIGRLALQYDAPIFEPHLTLAIGPDSAAEGQRIPTGIADGPIELHAAGIHFAPGFTKALFIRFNPSPELERLRNSLGLTRREDQPFDPHVSLLYKNIPVETQLQIAAALKLPFQTAKFDAMRVVRCRVPVASSADVTSWEVIAACRLTT